MSEVSVETVTKPRSVDRIELCNSYVDYSPSEIQLFNMVPKDGSKITSKRLVEIKVKKFKWDIDNPTNALWVTMDSLIKKIKKNRQGFRLMRSEKSGPHSQKYWIERI